MKLNIVKAILPKFEWKQYHIPVLPKFIINNKHLKSNRRIVLTINLISHKQQTEKSGLHLNYDM